MGAIPIGDTSPGDHTDEGTLKIVHLHGYSEGSGALASLVLTEGQYGAVALLACRTGRYVVVLLYGRTEAAIEASEPAANGLRQRQLSAGERVAQIDRYEGIWIARVSCSPLNSGQSPRTGSSDSQAISLRIK